jgi:hypothetical protein
MKRIPKKLESAFCDALREQGHDAGKHGVAEVAALLLESV